MRKAIPVLILLLALLLSACGGRAAEPYSLTIWYVDTPLSPVVERLAEDYNRTHGRDTLPVTLRAWESSEQLLSTLQHSAAPALILCPHTLAFTLSEAGLLKDAGVAAPAYPDWLCERAACIGQGYFPVGFSLPLLCVPEGTPDRVSELLTYCADRGRETGSPCLFIDRFAPLFYQVLLDNGTEFHAHAARDAFSKDYVNLYNQLAEAVFDGGLTLDESAGNACRIESSTALSGEDLAGCTLRPLSAGPLLAEGFGFAVTVRETRMQRALPDFLRWLLKPGRLGQAALDTGLIPAVADKLSPRDALEAELVRLMDHPLHLPDPDREYYVNQSAFEGEFRAAMELLR